MFRDWQFWAALAIIALFAGAGVLTLFARGSRG